MDIVDYTDWQRLAAMVEELGGVKVLDKAINDGTVEVHEVTGGGGSITLARHVRRRCSESDLAGAGWMTIHEMAFRLNCDTRTVSTRVNDGVMERKLVGGRTGGGVRSYVRMK